MPELFVPAELLPHRSGMSFLDTVRYVENLRAGASVNHLKISLLSNKEGRTPAWVGIEYMAQTVALVGGFRCKHQGKKPQIGFLLGTRHYHSDIEYFELGQTVDIDVEADIYDEDTGMAAFKCQISTSGTCVAEATIKAVQPHNVASVLASLETHSS